jgi:hypothetical protein
VLSVFSAAAIVTSVALLLAATACAAIFCGAAVYITFVEHPARLSCGADVALREFAPAYKRGTVMQASLAVIGALAGLVAASLRHDGWIAVAAILLGAVVPFTLIVILPTNKKLLDPALKPAEGMRLLDRWGRLHAVRSMLSSASFAIFLLRLASHAAIGG